MFKKIVIVFLLMLGLGNLNAQTVKVSVGMKGYGGYTLANTDIPSEFGGLLGGGGGAFTGIKIANIVGIQAEVLADYNFGAFSDSSLKASTNQVYLHIPMVVQIWCGRSVAFEAGYQQSIAMSGKLNLEGQSMDDKGILDYGSAVAGVHFNLGKILFLNLRYCHALTPSYVQIQNPAKYMNIQLSVGFRIFNSKKSVFE